MPESINPIFKVIAERKHRTLKIREEQLGINLLGLYGGRPYVDARLSRFAGEDKTDWEGGTRSGDGSKITGRKQQAHVIPYLGRIAEKINQYVLGTPPKRDGLDAGIAADLSDEGESITEVMKTVNNYVTACRWCWIGIDAPAILPDRQLSQAEKEARKIRPYWTVYSPLKVVDWYIDKTGRLHWLLTETVDYIARTPLLPAVNIKYRRLWEPGRVTAFKYKPDDPAKIIDAEEIDTTFGKVPFIPVGTISEKPHRFDDLESINRSIMDLESCNRQNFFNTVFPQPYFPVSVLDTITNRFEVNAQEAVSMLMGFNYPVLLQEGDPTPGYIMPDSSAIGTMREELGKLRKELFDTVGLMLQQETRQVASAESKAWDFLDIQAVMKERAEILETAEAKAAELSHEFDAGFPAWKPEYNKDFDVSNFKDEIQAIVSTANMSMPDELQRFVLRKLFDRLNSLGGDKADEDERARILEAIEAFGGVSADALLGAASFGGTE